MAATDGCIAESGRDIRVAESPASSQDRIAHLGIQYLGFLSLFAPDYFDGASEEPLELQTPYQDTYAYASIIYRICCGLA
jgi:hypothetical protein